MIKDVLVTIVIPVYNGERFLRENIESILEQTHENLEIIYVCAGCWDRSVEILQKYASEDKRVNVHIEEENHGAAASRNLGMKMANGEWLIFLDCDDMFAPDMIEAMLGKAISEKADVCCCFWEKFDDEPTKKADVINDNLKLYCKTYPLINVKEEEKHILQLVFHCQWGRLIHQTIYKNESVYFQSLPNSDDVYYSLVTAMEAKRIVYVDRVLVYYRSNKGRVTLTTDQDKRENLVWEAYDEIYQYICRRNNNHELKKSFYNRICGNILNLIGVNLYEEVFGKLYRVYFKKWGMQEINIKEDLSYLNQEVYKNISIGYFLLNIDELIMQAKVSFVKDIAEREACSIWGYGYYGKKLIEKLELSNIRYNNIFDSDSEKWGLYAGKKEIKKFEGNRVENIIVTSRSYFEEIKLQIGDRANHVYNLEKEIYLY